MAIRWNISPHNVTVPRTVRVTSRGEDVRRYVGPAVVPGESHDFTDDEAASLGWEWSETDPRAGLSDERDFKRRRDAVPVEVVEPESTAPAESGENEGESS